MGFRSVMPEGRCVNCGKDGQLRAIGLCGACNTWQKKHNGEDRPTDGSVHGRGGDMRTAAQKAAAEKKAAARAAVQQRASNSTRPMAIIAKRPLKLLSDV